MVALLYTALDTLTPIGTDPFIIRGPLLMATAFTIIRGLVGALAWALATDGSDGDITHIIDPTGGRQVTMRDTDMAIITDTTTVIITDTTMATVQDMPQPIEIMAIGMYTNNKEA